MNFRSCLRTLALGYLTCQGVPLAIAQEQVAEPRKLAVELDAVSAANQKTADAVAAAIGQNPKLKGFRIDVVVENGIVELHGRVGDAAQRELAGATARGVTGVASLRDHLVVGTSDVRPVQDVVPNKDGGPQLTPPPSGPFPPPPGPVAPGPVPPGAGGPPFMPIPNNGYGPPPVGTPANHPGMIPNPQYQPPPLPPYSWPTYAPYNNYSRVATPTQYTYNQWPFIGPMYPYPKIPLGWRRITLEWQDGAWWYGRESNSHDWWRIRYW